MSSSSTTGKAPATTTCPSRILSLLDASSTEESSSWNFSSSSYQMVMASKGKKTTKSQPKLATSGISRTQSSPAATSGTSVRPVNAKRALSSVATVSCEPALTIPVAGSSSKRNGLPKPKSTNTIAQGSLRSSSTNTMTTSTAPTTSLLATTAPNKTPRGRKPKGTDPIDALIPLLPIYDFNDSEWGKRTPVVVYITNVDEANEMIPTLRGPVGFDLEWKVIFHGHRRSPTHYQTGLVQVADSRTILLIHLSAMKSFPAELKRLVEDKDIIKIGVNIKRDGEKLYQDFRILPRGLLELGVLAKVADPRSGRNTATQVDEDEEDHVAPAFDAPVPAIATGENLAPIPGLEVLDEVAQMSKASSRTKAKPTRPEGDAAMPPNIAVSASPPNRENLTTKNVDAQTAVLALREHGFPYTRPIVSLAKMVALYAGRQVLKDDVRTSDWDCRLNQEQIQYAANDAHSALLIYNQLLALAKDKDREIDVSSLTTCVNAARQLTTVAMPDTPPMSPPAEAEEQLQPGEWDATPPPESAPSSRSSSTAPTTQSTFTARSQYIGQPPARSFRSGSTGARQLSAGVVPGQPVKPNHLRAYRLWHVQGLSLPNICAILKDPPYAESTVITFIIGALQADAGAPFDADNLRQLVGRNRWCKEHHGPWVEEVITRTENRM